MSEEQTFSIDNATETVSAEENLTEDEQDSLKVGEEMEAQEEQLLAGKYKDAAELENAYKELEKKLGEKSDEVSEEEKPTDDKEEEAPKEDQDNIIERVFEAGQKDELNEDLLKELQGTSNQDLAKLALEYKQKSTEQQSRELSDADVEQLKNIVGGDQNYSTIMGWAQENVPEQDINMFDAVVEKGDPLACYFAIQALAYRYQEATGRDGQMITGKAPKSTADTFKSQAEMIKAMEDDRYSDDPAYRQAILEKLERSNINF